MYEELVKRLKETTVNHDDKCESCPYEEDYPCCVDCIDEMHIEAANAIEELEKFYQIMADAYETEVTKERWIPVTERLPEPGWYLVRCNEVHKHIHRIAYYYNYCNPAWYEDSNNITEFVTHWISLPEPPKEET